MGAVITSKLPCHYVDYLCHPELKTRGGIVPLHALLDLDQSWTAQIRAFCIYSVFERSGYRFA